MKGARYSSNQSRSEASLSVALATWLKMALALGQQRISTPLSA
jgi:hypothetical protein